MWRLAFVSLSLLLFFTSVAQPVRAKAIKNYRVTVWLIDGSKQSGLWLKCSDRFITYLVNEVPVEIPAEQIYKLEFNRENSSKRNAIIGASIGFTLGFLAGYTGDDAEGYPGASRVGHAAGAGLIGAFSGAFIGHLTGMIGKSYLLIGNLERYRELKPQLEKYNSEVTR